MLWKNYCFIFIFLIFLISDIFGVTSNLNKYHEGDNNAEPNYLIKENVRTKRHLFLKRWHKLGGYGGGYGYGSSYGVCCQPSINNVQNQQPSYQVQEVHTYSIPVPAPPPPPPPVPPPQPPPPQVTVVKIPVVQYTQPALPPPPPPPQKKETIVIVEHVQQQHQQQPSPSSGGEVCCQYASNGHGGGEVYKSGHLSFGGGFGFGFGGGAGGGGGYSWKRKK